MTITTDPVSPIPALSLSTQNAYSSTIPTPSFKIKNLASAQFIQEKLEPCNSTKWHKFLPNTEKTNSKHDTGTITWPSRGCVCSLWVHWMTHSRMICWELGGIPFPIQTQKVSVCFNAILMRMKESSQVCKRQICTIVNSHAQSILGQIGCPGSLIGDPCHMSTYGWPNIFCQLFQWLIWCSSCPNCKCISNFAGL